MIATKIAFYDIFILYSASREEKGHVMSTLDDSAAHIKSQHSVPVEEVTCRKECEVGGRAYTGSDFYALYQILYRHTCN